MDFNDKELYEKFHENFIENVSRIPKETPIFLSGGIDSATILFASIELGRKPQCISFNHDGVLSGDNIVGADMCRHFGLDYDLVEIDSSYDSLVKKTKYILRNVGKTRRIKTTVQVGIPLIEMCKRAIELGYGNSICGWNGDCLAGSGRWGAKAEIKGEFNECRKRVYFKEDCSEKNILRDILEPKFKFGMEDPYKNKNLEWIMDIPFDRIHKPFQKSVFVGYYEKLWGNFKLRKNKSLQVEGGTRDLMEEMFVSCPKLNINKHKSVVGILNEMRTIEKQNVLF